MADTTEEPKDATFVATQSIPNGPSEPQILENPTLSPSNDPKSALAARMARFKSLQAVKEANKAATAKEVRNANTDIEARNRELATLQRKGDIATYKLERSEDPEAFERKRAWDYTVEESENWDKRMKKKARARDNVAFSDWRAEANKNYKRQVTQMGKVDLDSYLASKAEKLQNQVSSGLLELVETEDGDVFTIDKLGRVNTPADESVDFEHKPSKEAVDRLVNDLEKGERARLKARAARGLNDDDKSDVTYINQKNKQFNEKLARFYNRYTTEIRESFERGTAL